MGYVRESWWINLEGEEREVCFNESADFNAIEGVVNERGERGGYGMWTSDLCERSAISWLSVPQTRGGMTEGII